MRVPAGLHEPIQTRKAERGGFEPPVPCGTSVFKTGAFGHSATSPRVSWSSRSDCRQFADCVNHSFLTVTRAFWLKKIGWSLEIFRRAIHVAL